MKEARARAYIDSILGEAFHLEAVIDRVALHNVLRPDSELDAHEKNTKQYVLDLLDAIEEAGNRDAASVEAV